MTPSPSPLSEPGSGPEPDPDGNQPEHPGRTALSPSDAPGAQKMPDIRRQAIAAIEELMALSGTDSAYEQAQLRLLIEAHPGKPEIALAKHLLALRPYFETRGAGKAQTREIAPETD